MALADLRDVLQGTCNKHDQVTVLIQACINEGVDTRRALADELTSLGYDRALVIVTLNTQVGASPGCCRWWRDEQGRYRLHE
jgi:hypothetical protein